jgi:FkbM family methyltransferase
MNPGWIVPVGKINREKLRNFLSKFHGREPPDRLNFGCQDPRKIRARIFLNVAKGPSLLPLSLRVNGNGVAVNGSSCKNIVLGGYPLKISGLAADDRYFTAITSDFEIEFCSLCSRLVLPDYICIDVGANIGIKSLFLSRHCSRGQVVAIEAAPTVVECLEANIAANNATNIHVEKTVVGDRKGSVGFVEESAWGHVSEGHVSQKPVSTIDPDDAGDCVEVPITTLVEIVERLNLPRVDFIKIDVEGSEFSIMRSSLDLINRFECLVLVEFSSWTLLLSGVNPREFIEWLLASFSHVFILRRDNSDGDLLEPVTNVRAFLSRNIFADNCVTDLLLTNAERRLAPSPSFLEKQLKVSTARCASLYAELNTVRDECEAAKAECQAATAGLNALQAKIEGVFNSWSWRVTAPLRWFRDQLAKLK